MPRLTIRRLMALVAVAAVLLCFVRVHRSGDHPDTPLKFWWVDIGIPGSWFLCSIYDCAGHPDVDFRQIGLVDSRGCGIKFCSRPEGAVIFVGDGPYDYSLVYGLWLRKGRR